MQLVQAIDEANRRIKSLASGVQTTPLEYSSALSDLTGARVYLKCEHQQRSGSFKFRGALNKLASLNPDQKTAGVLAASTGNHGISVALAAKILGLDALIYIPSEAPDFKIGVIRRLGAQIKTIEGDCLAAEKYARQQAKRTGKTFVSPYNDIQVIAGQGTMGLELLEQHLDLSAVFVTVGGGGLISGIGAYLKAHRPKTKVLGCWPEASPVMLRCMEARKIIEVEERSTLSESTIGGLEYGSITLPVCLEVVDGTIVVDEAAIKFAMKLLARHEHWIVEGAAAVALAGLLKQAAYFKDQAVAVVLCGRNINLDTFLSVIR